MSRYASIAHHVPGRVRLKVSAARGDSHFLQAVVKAVSGIPEVRRVHANPRTGSVVIEYRADQKEAFSQHAITRLSYENDLLSLLPPDVAVMEKTIAATEAG